MATKRWVANAAPVTDLWTISLSGTVVSQTYTMTIGTKTVAYTASGADTVAVILLALQTAWNSSVLPEFAELTAAALPAGGPYTSMTVTADISGKPSTVSVSTSGAATFSIANTTPATGPNFFNNAANWSTNTAPANSDTLVFDYGSTPCLYALSTSLTGIILSVELGFYGTMGLPFNNSDNSSTPYQEYRATSLTLAGGTATINSANVMRCNLAFGANACTVRVLQNGPSVDPVVPTVLVTGGDGTSVMDISKGYVGVAYYQGTTATFLTIKTSYTSNTITDVTLALGVGLTVTNVVKNGGTLTTKAGVTTLTQGISGGITTVSETAAVTTLDVQGGTVVYNSTGTLGTATVENSGTLDFNQDQRAKTVTNPIQLYGDAATVRDDQKLVNSGTLTVKFNKSSKFNISHGSDNTVTVA